jgi:GTPase SAR1 family protein
LVYDITCKKSYLDAINNWYQEALQYGNKRIYFILVGNKIDLEEERAVSFQEAESFA